MPVDPSAPRKDPDAQPSEEATSEHGMSDATLELIARDVRARTYSEWLWMVEEIQSLRVKLREREAQALERAAKVAGSAAQAWCSFPGFATDGRADAVRKVAAAIRALKVQS